MIIEGRITDLLFQQRGAEPRLNILFTDDTAMPGRRGYCTNLWGREAEEGAARLKNGDLIRVDGIISEIEEDWNQVRRRYIEAVRITRVPPQPVPWVEVAPQLKIDRYA